jgi:hypothetical protein
MENNQKRDGIQDGNTSEENRSFDQNQNLSQPESREDENGAGGTLAPSRQADERDRANDGDWSSLRNNSGAYDDATDGQTDQGGAGSTGSEATNSGTPGTL